MKQNNCKGGGLAEGGLHNNDKERRGGAHNEDDSTPLFASMELSLVERATIGNQSHCGPTRHSGKPLLPPAITTATKTRTSAACLCPWIYLPEERGGANDDDDSTSLSTLMQLSLAVVVATMATQGPLITAPVAAASV
jgi:hypothetical protein